MCLSRTPRCAVALSWLYCTPRHCPAGGVASCRTARWGQAALPGVSPAMHAPMQRSRSDGLGKQCNVLHTPAAFCNRSWCTGWQSAPSAVQASAVLSLHACTPCSPGACSTAQHHERCALDPTNDILAPFGGAPSVPPGGLQAEEEARHNGCKHVYQCPAGGHTPKRTSWLRVAPVERHSPQSVITRASLAKAPPGPGSCFGAETLSCTQKAGKSGHAATAAAQPCRRMPCSGCRPVEAGGRDAATLRPDRRAATTQRRPGGGAGQGGPARRQHPCGTAKQDRCSPSCRTGGGRV